MTPSNAVYTGKLWIELRGHKYELRGWEGYEYREAEGSPHFIFQPEGIDPDLETLDEFRVWKKVLTNQRLNEEERAIRQYLQDSIKFRVSEDDLTLIR